MLLLPARGIDTSKSMAPSDSDEHVEQAPDNASPIFGRICAEFKSESHKYLAR